MLKNDLPSDVQTEQWGRMPKPGQRLLGLSRKTLLELSDAGKIKTVAIKKPGAIRGIRLIFMPTLLEYLESLAQEVSTTR